MAEERRGGLVFSGDREALDRLLSPATAPAPPLLMINEGGPMRDVRMTALRSFALPGSQGHAWPADADGHGGTEFAATEDEARELEARGLAVRVSAEDPVARETKPASEPRKRERKG